VSGRVARRSLVLAGLAGLLTLLPASGCKKQGPSIVDLDLPEKPTITSQRPPLEILEDAAGSLDPSHRGHALSTLIATARDPGGGEWGPRALYDPDAWVQRQGVQALVGRLSEPETVEHLEAYVSRDSADPYSRSYAAVRLQDHSSPALRDALSEAWRTEPMRWKAAPLALGALVHGDDDARVPLSAALARGDVALEPQFIADVGRSGRPELLDALQEGEDWVEPELALAYAVARISLGDPSGEQLLRKALGSDDSGAQLEALTHLSEIQGPIADALLKRARNQGSDLVRAWAELALAARGQADPSVIVVASGSADAEIRALAARFAGERLAAGDLRSRKATRQLENVLRTALVDARAIVRRGALLGLERAPIDDRDVLLNPVLADDSLENRLQAAGMLLEGQ
jgi:hypothetical protein